MKQKQKKLKNSIKTKASDPDFSTSALKVGKITPILASGFKDYLPKEMIPRQKMIDAIRSVFELFGFAPLDTPMIEKEEILTGADPNFNKQIFRLASNKENKDLSDLALRFDLTVPLARVMAANQNISRPFKRYQISKVFRGESAQAGRYKEFLQCDADIVGSESSMADAEIIAVVYKILRALQVENFKIKINNRKILEGVQAYIGIDSKMTQSLIRAMDKIGKVTRAEVARELELSSDQAKRLDEIVDFKNAGELEVFLKQIRQEGIAEMNELTKNLAYLGVPQENLVFSPYLARGLSYYTGIVFETFLDDMPEIGSVASGGRYDGLIEKFSKNKMPAVGVSIGLDRLFAALEKLGRIEKKSRIADVLVLNFESDGEAEAEIQKAATSLRAAEIKTEIYLGSENSFKGQLAYAVKNEYPIVVIIGNKELERGIIQVKDMNKKEQAEVLTKDLVQKIKNILNV